MAYGSNSLASLGIDISADIGRLRSDFQMANREASKQMGDLRRNVEGSLGAMEGRAKMAAQSIMASLGAIGAIEIGKRLATVADGYANVQAKIKLVTRSNEDFIRTSNQVYQIAQDTYTAYDAVATMVGRTARSLESLGSSNAKALTDAKQLAETVTQGLMIGGATASESSASVIQLTQALASNKLAGDEFRSFMENAPRLSGALSESLGVTIGELRKLSKEGKLTTDIVTTALLSQANVIKEEFGTVPLTIGRAWQQLSNEFMVFIGQGAQVSGVGMDIAEAIQFVGENLNVLGGIIAGGAVLLLIRQMASATAATIAWADAQVMSAAFTNASAMNTARDAEMAAVNAAATLAAAEAKLVEARASAAQVQATSAVIVVAQQEQIIKLRSLEVEAAKATTMLVAARAAGAQSAALMVVAEAEAALMRIEAARMGVVNELAALGLNNARAMAAQTTAATALATAEAELAIAQNAAAGAATRAATASTMAAGATGAVQTGIKGLGAGLLAFVGGPIGLTIAGVAALAYGLYALDDSADSAMGKAKQLTAQFDKAAAAAKRFSTDPIKMINTSSAEIDLELMKDYQRELKILTDMQAKPGQGFSEVMRATQMDAQKGKVQMLKEALNELRVSTAMAAEAERERQSEGRKAGEELQAKARAMMAASLATGGSAEADKAAAKAARELEAEHRKGVKALEASNKMLDEYSEKYAKWVEQTTEGFEGVRDSVDPMSKLNDEFARQKVALEEAAALWAGQPEKMAEVARVTALLTAQYDENAEAAEAMVKPHKKGIKDVVQQIEDQQDSILGVTGAQARYNQQVRDANRLAQIAIKNGADEIEIQKGQVEWIEKLGELRDNATIADAIAEFGGENPFEEMTSTIELLEEALNKAIGEKAVEKIEVLQRTIRGMRKELAGPTTGAFLELGQVIVGTMKESAAEGSRTMAATQLAAAGLAMVQGILAILNQGQGDTYTAPFRMAAMAAVVIPLAAQAGAAISMAGASGFSDTAAERQASQGTGSVLGDADAKSESILNATEITADATTALVGLNRGMLTALRALQNALGAAGGMLARGAGDADFSGMDLAVDGAGSGMFDGKGLLGRLLTGSSKITDQGIIIFGGALNELLESVAVGAYQEVQSRSWAFGDLTSNEGVVDVSDEFGNQFQLVIQSIADTVREGALALGLLPADVEAAMAAFQVEEMRISLKDLSAEEQQAELEAVFSKLFDDLAVAVVPFIEQFQMVGEGLGETLIRIATEVQVVQQAFLQLGMAFDVTDPEQYAQLADGLVQASGGLENFIAGLQSFVSNFASDSHQFKVVSEAITSAFDQVGLSLPATREGMWDLMQSLDATTQEGKEQIATLLRLADASDQYYSALEDQEEALNEARELLGELGMVGGITDFRRELQRIEDTTDEAIDALNLLARSEGRAGASARDLAMVHRWAADQARQAIAALRSSTMDLVSQLYGGTPGSMDEVNRRIQELESTQIDGIDSVGQAAQDMYERQLDAIRAIDEFLDSLLLGDLTTLTPEQQLMEAQSQYEELLALAQAGDADALAALPEAARAYLEQARSFYSATDGYSDIFDGVFDDLQDIVDTGAGANPGPGGTGNGASVDELNALYMQRDQIQAQHDAQQRLMLAQQLASQLADLSQALGIPVFELADQMGVSMEMLVADLGINLTEFTETTGAELAGVAAMLGVTVPELAAELGVSMNDLVTSMGINLDDLSQNTAASIGAVAETLGLTVPELTAALGIGMEELVSAMGINLTDLTTETVQAMALLAGDMGMSLVELAESVGVDLGELSDSQSLLNQSLADTIEDLPEGTREHLQDLLAAISDATTEADANAAIEALRLATEGLPEDQRALLAPYFDTIDPTEQLDDLDWLEDISTASDEQLVVLGSMKEYLRQIESYLDDNPNSGGGMLGQGGGQASSQGLEDIDAALESALRTYGVETAPEGGPSVAAAIDRLRDCIEENDAETRQVLIDRLEALEDAVNEGAVKQSMAVAKAVGQNRNGW